MSATHFRGGVAALCHARTPAVRSAARSAGTDGSEYLLQRNIPPEPPWPTSTRPSTARASISRDVSAPRLSGACARPLRRTASGYEQARAQRARARACAGRRGICGAVRAVRGRFCAALCALFWDTLRQRGNGYIEHERQGQPPVLHFEYEMVLGRALVRAPGELRAGAHRPAGGRRRSTERSVRTSSSIRAPATARASAASRTTRRSASRCAPAIRSTSSSSSASRSPGRRCSTSCDAGAASSCARVRELHPTAPSRAIVGNCQGGWAAMMLAAADPDDTGPIVINGAPMSYWGGAWQRRRGRQPDALLPAACSAAPGSSSLVPRSRRRQVRRRLPGRRTSRT